MAVEDLGTEVQMIHGFQHSLGIEGKAFAVIDAAIDAVTPEIIVVVDEINAQLSLGALQLQNADIALAPAQIHGEFTDLLHGDVLILLDGLVIRQEEADLHVFLFGQGDGQRLHDVAQTAGLQEGCRLSGSHCDFHTLAPFSIIIGCSRVPFSTV